MLVCVHNRSYTKMKWLGTIVLVLSIQALLQLMTEARTGRRACGGPSMLGQALTLSQTSLSDDLLSWTLITSNVTTATAVELPNSLASTNMLTVRGPLVDAPEGGGTWSTYRNVGIQHAWSRRPTTLHMMLLSPKEL